MSLPLYKPKIFISHSARETLAKTTLAGLRSALEANGYTVLVDQEGIRPSSSWRAAIDEWIWRCDAAVILLSVKALSSQYVKYETTLLRQRWKERNGSFILLPTVIPPATPARVDAAMSPLQLNEIQHLVPSAAAVDNKAFVKEVVSSTLKNLELIPKRGAARNELEATLIDILYHQCETDEALEDIGGKLLTDTIAAGAKKDRAIALARAILDMDATRGSARFKLFRPVVLKMLSILEYTYTKRVINIVTPFCWVDPEVAAQLSLVALHEKPPRTVAWGRSWPLSEMMYLRRGCGRLKVHKVEVSNVWSGDMGEDLEHVRRCLSDALYYYPDATVEDINQRIRELEDEGNPVFLVAQAGPLDQSLALAIQKSWPRLTLFLFDEELSKSQLEERGMERAVLLEPLLDRAVEKNARSEWGELMSMTDERLDHIKSGEAFRA